MTDPKFLSRFRDELVDALRAQPHPTVPEPLDITKWQALSLLQKSVRRGNRDFAQKAALTLLRTDPEHLLRRLNVVAAEDIGIAAPEILDLTIAGSDKRFRTQTGEWPLVSYLVSRMTGARKDRSADDLSFAAEVHPQFKAVRAEFVHLATQQLLDIVTSTAHLVERAIALKLVLGKSKRSLQLTARRGDAHAAVFNHLTSVGVAPHLAAIARESYRKTGEHLAPLAALVSLELGWRTATTSDDPMPPAVMIGNLPCWTYDMFTREGRATLVRFLGTDAESARWVVAHIPPARRLELIGNLVFFVESCLLSQKLNWAVGDELRRMASVECLGVGDGTVILELMRADLPRLNELRFQMCGGAANAR